MSRDSRDAGPESAGVLTAEVCLCRLHGEKDLSRGARGPPYIEEIGSREWAPPRVAAWRYRDS